MKKIVPFKKDLFFKSSIEEITSISLEHSLQVSNNMVNGNFIINGEYKQEDNAANEVFNFEVPFDISIDDKYDTSNVKLDIDDFYYEIVDKNKLQVNIDVLIDNLDEIKEDRCIEEEVPFTNQIEATKLDIEEEKKEDVKSLFDNFDDNESYASYYVYIVREGDTIDTILQKYLVTRDDLSLYNDLSSIKIGDKIIIPNISAKI